MALSNRGILLDTGPRWPEGWIRPDLRQDASHASRAEVSNVCCPFLSSWACLLIAWPHSWLRSVNPIPTHTHGYRSQCLLSTVRCGFLWPSHTRSRACVAFPSCSPSTDRPLIATIQPSAVDSRTFQMSTGCPNIYCRQSDVLRSALTGIVHPPSVRC